MKTKKAETSKVCKDCGIDHDPEWHSGQMPPISKPTKIEEAVHIEIEGSVNAPLEMILKEAEKRGWNQKQECNAIGRLYQKYNPFV